MEGTGRLEIYRDAICFAWTERIVPTRRHPVVAAQVIKEIPQIAAISSMTRIPRS
jgi:hypothetical protein